MDTGQKSVLWLIGIFIDFCRFLLCINATGSYEPSPNLPHTNLIRYVFSHAQSVKEKLLLPERLCLCGWVCQLISRIPLPLPGFATCPVFQLLWLYPTVKQRGDPGGYTQLGIPLIAGTWRAQCLLLALNSLLPSAEPKKRQCRALFEYNPVNEDELELKVGDIVDILEEVLQTCLLWVGWLSV